MLHRRGQVDSQNHRQRRIKQSLKTPPQARTPQSRLPCRAPKMPQTHQSQRKNKSKTPKQAPIPRRGDLHQRVHGTHQKVHKPKRNRKQASQPKRQNNQTPRNGSQSSQAGFHNALNPHPSHAICNPPQNPSATHPLLTNLTAPFQNHPQNPNVTLDFAPHSSTSTTPFSRDSTFPTPPNKIPRKQLTPHPVFNHTPNPPP
jgi:hypothetical protein